MGRSEYVFINRNARFLTDYYNYDQGWPEISADAQPLSNPVIPTFQVQDLQPYLTNLVQKKAQIDRIREQIDASKQVLQQGLARLNKLINSAHVQGLPSADCSLEEFKAQLDHIKQTEQRQLDYECQALAHAESTRSQLSAQVARLSTQNPELSDQTDSVPGKTSRSLHRWMIQRLGVITQSGDDSRVTLRIEPTTVNSTAADPPADQRSVTLIRGVRRRDRVGRLLLTDLEVVSAQRTDSAQLARCASASLAPGALVACLLHNLHVDQCLRADIQRLRAQYPLDWDPNSRQLHLLSTEAGILASLTITPDGSLSLTRLQHRSGQITESEDVTNDRLIAHLAHFTPPPSRSLDEWLAEVNDFCANISLSGSAC